jgi:hypothetical protein
VLTHTERNDDDEMRRALMPKKMKAEDRSTTRLRQIYKRTHLLHPVADEPVSVHPGNPEPFGDRRDRDARSGHSLSL